MTLVEEASLIRSKRSSRAAIACLLRFRRGTALRKFRRRIVIDTLDGIA